MSSTDFEKLEDEDYKLERDESSFEGGSDVSLDSKSGQLELLVSEGKIPNGLIPVPENQWTDFDSFDRISNMNPHAAEKMAVVINNAKWAAVDRETTDGKFDVNATIYSGDGEMVAKHIRRTRFGLYRSGIDGLSVSDYRHFNTTIPKEEKEMELNDLAKELEQQQQNEGGNANPMTTFNNQSATGGGEGGDNTPAQKGFSPGVKEKMRNVQAADPAQLYAYNRIHAEAFGYIVDTPEMISVQTRMVPMMDAEGKHILKVNPPEEVAKKHAETGKAPRAYIEEEGVLSLKNNAPGRIRAMIINMPIAGWVDFNDFRKKGSLSADTTKGDEKRVLVLDADTYPTFIMLYFGGEIRESKRTHGELATTLRQRNAHKTETGDAVAATDKISRRLYPDGRRSVLVPGNHLPIDVYETVSYTANLTDEQIDLLNVSTFKSLLESKPAKTSTTGKSRYDLLRADEAVKVRYDEQNNIVSSYFTKDNAARITPEIKPYYNPQGENLEVSRLRFPVKRVTIKKDGTEGPLRYKRFSLLNEDHLKDPEIKSKLSLYSGEYKPFIDAVGADVLTVEKIREIRNAAKAGGPSAGQVSNDDVRLAYLGVTADWISTSEVQIDGMDAGKISALNGKLVEMRESAMLKSQA